MPLAFLQKAMQIFRRNVDRGIPAQPPNTVSALGGTEFQLSLHRTRELLLHVVHPTIVRWMGSPRGCRHIPLLHCPLFIMVA